MPKGLIVRNGEFKIKGKEVKPIKREIISGKYFGSKVLPSVLFAGVAAGMVYMTSSISNKPNWQSWDKSTMSNRKRAYIACGIAVTYALGYLIHALSGKTRDSFRKTITDQKRIRYNNNLTKEIAEKKSNIKVKMNLKEKK